LAVTGVSPSIGLLRMEVKRKQRATVEIAGHLLVAVHMSHE
jgi:hypothetical protein